ncbi:MAG: class I lanthipeptide [Kordia sp.]|uniref:class I lanthipeptide n=1 Tax=Kordia sp. TaxID=1965332 RepID=UPI003858A516
MKKQLRKLSLNKKQVSHLTEDTLKGGTSWPPRETPTDSCFFNCGETGGQTGSWCLTGNQTNCQ